MYHNAINSQLIELEAGNSGSFYCLEEKSPVLENSKAIVFLHGLGENRSGLNYLFHELSQGLTEVGYAVYRFDLGGCGESELPLSLDTWKKQLASLENSLKKKYHQIHLIARGAASLLLPRMGTPTHIAIGPLIDHFFLENYSLIPLEEHSENWIPKVEQHISLTRECFWTMLGVEAGCLGGFSITKQFLDDMRINLDSICKGWAVIFAGKMCPFATYQRNLHYLPNCHPLFFYQSDRKTLLKQIKEILKDDRHEV